VKSRGVNKLEHKAGNLRREAKDRQATTPCRVDTSEPKAREKIRCWDAAKLRILGNVEQGGERKGELTRGDSLGVEKREEWQKGVRKEFSFRNCGGGNCRKSHLCQHAAGPYGCISKNGEKKAQEAHE